ncbi:MAG: FAD:protein FMN transferase [Frankiaceae bacterium]
MASTTIPHRAWVEQVMGMPVSVHVRGQAARADDTARLVYAAFEELRVIDARFSTYSADSEVSRLNRAELSLAAVHPSMSEVLELCEVARKRTGGHFNAHCPDPAAHGERRFDPSGLVKGWAIEQMAARLARSTGCDVSVNAGVTSPETRAASLERPGGSAWRTPDNRLG